MKIIFIKFQVLSFLGKIKKIIMENVNREESFNGFGWGFRLVGELF
jgi:hypothetical protein